MDMIMQTLIEGLTTGNSAKVGSHNSLQETLYADHGSFFQIRWNAATAIGNSLSSPLFSLGSEIHRPDLLPSHQSLLLECLLTTLADPTMSNYKVRIQAAKSLRVLRASESYGSDALFDSIRMSIERAQLVVREEEELVNPKEKDHWEQLVLEVSFGKNVSVPRRACGESLLILPFSLLR